MSEIDPEKLEIALDAAHYCGPGSELIVRAARAHLATLPKTKEVAVWHVEFAEYYDNRWDPLVSIRSSEASARTYAEEIEGRGARCVRVTGPHTQRVPV